MRPKLLASALAEKPLLPMASRGLLLLLLLTSQLARAEPEPTGADPTLESLPVQTLPEAAPTPPVAAETVQSPAALDTVVVTARRKKEKVEVVPISMTVLDGDQLAAAGLYRPQDIQERVPGLVVSVPNPRLTSYTIRGLGSSSANDGLESSVGLFLDGVYLGRQGLSVFDLVDLERVEVLRGPQGTLFGKNTTAGAFNIVTKAPTPEFEARAEGSVGNLGYRQWRGSINGGLIGETLSGRLTGYLTRRDGSIENLHDDRTFQNQNKGGLRGQLLWAQSENFSSRLIYEYADAHEDCCVFLLTSYREAIQQRDAYIEYQREPVNPYARQVQYDSQVSIEMHQKAVSNEINWSFGDGGATTLTSISAWRDWRFVPYNDDATSRELVPLSGSINNHQQWSQELRLARQQGDVDLVGGLFLIEQRLVALDRFVVGKDLIPWAFGGILRDVTGLPLTQSNSGLLFDLIAPGENAAGTANLTRGEQTSRSGALFGSLDWHLRPRFDATFGLRYTRELKKGSVVRTRTASNTGGTVDPNDPASLPQLPGALFAALGLPDPRNYTLGLILDQVIGAPYSRATSYDEGQFSGQFALGYQWTPAVRSYLSIGHGYKAGGINLGVTGASVKETFEPETATSFELGLKSQFFRRRLGLNLAAYHSIVRNYQALTFDNEPTLFPNPAQVNLLNVGKVRLQGLELEGRARPWSWLSLRAGGSYGRAVTVDFKNAPDEDARTSTKDLSGKRLYNAPIITATGGIEVTRALADNVEAYGAFDTSYRSDYYGTVERGRGSDIAAYSLSNLRLGLKHARGVEVSAWVRNLFNEDYIAAINPIYGVGDYGAVVGDQRTYGLSARLELR